jgi:hypothetical protein
MKRLLSRFLLAVLLLVGASELALRRAVADASGCSFTDGGAAGFKYDDTGTYQVPACKLGGTGCYECAFSRPGQTGYDLCTETSGGMNCRPDIPFPSWWPDPDYRDHGEPGDTPPPGDNPPGTGFGDDGGGADPGGGGGDFCTGCPPAYGTVPAYAAPTPLHKPYRG